MPQMSQLQRKISEDVLEGAAFAKRPERPAFASSVAVHAVMRLLRAVAATTVVVVLVLELEPVPAHAARVIVKGDVLPGAEAVRHEVSADPAGEASACGVDGCVL